MQQTSPDSSKGPVDSSKQKSERVRPVEYLLVAVIAGSVGVMAVPDMVPDIGSMEGLTQMTQLQYQLNNYRSAIGNYRADHQVYPGYGPGREGARLHGELAGTTFKYQMQLWSDEWGNHGPLIPGVYELGPYLETGLLKNPLNGLETVRLLRDSEPFPSEPNNQTGWYFKPLTGELRANSTGGSPLIGQSFYEL